MVDKANPTNQFHAYQPVDATPHSEEVIGGGLRDMLGKAGIDTTSLGAIGDRMKNVDVRKSVEKARGYARSNPALVLGGLAAAVIGLGLLRKRSR